MSPIMVEMPHPSSIFHRNFSQHKVVKTLMAVKYPQADHPIQAVLPSLAFFLLINLMFFT